MVGGGGVTLEDKGLGEASGYELRAGGAVDLASPWKAYADVGLRAMEDGEDSLTGGLALRGRQDLHDITAEWSYRDMDTFRASEAGIRFHRVSAVYRFHSALWPWVVQYLRTEINDGNSRDDARLQLFRRLPTLPQWQWGGTLEYADAGFQAPDYYTPERLLAPRLVVRYNHRGGETWSAGAEAGVGAVFDALNEDRPTGRGSFRLSKEWGPRTRTGMSAYYSSTAGYRLSGADFSLQRRF
jgi:hypothetical protein